MPATSAKDHTATVVSPTIQRKHKALREPRQCVGAPSVSVVMMAETNFFAYIYSKVALKEICHDANCIMHHWILGVHQAAANSLRFKKPSVPVKCNPVDLIELHSRSVHAILNSTHGKTIGMLDSIEALLFNSCHQLSVHENRCRGIMIEQTAGIMLLLTFPATIDT